MAKLHRFFIDDQEPVPEQPEIPSAQSTRRTTISSEIPARKQEKIHKIFQEPIEPSEPEKLPQGESSILKQIAKESSAGIFGTYGDIAELIVAQKKDQPSLLPHQKTRAEREAKATPEELVGLSEDEDIVPQYGKLPTQEDLRGAALKFFNIGEAQTPTERIAGRAASLGGSALALGGHGAVGKGGLQALKTSASNVGKGAMAGALGQSTRESGGPEWAATAVEIGSPVGASIVKSIIGGKTASKLAGSLYNAADSSITETAVGDAKELESSLVSLNKKMKLGTEAPSEKAVIDETEKLLSKIKDGKMSYKEAAASRRSLNEKMQETIFKTPDKAAKGRARKLFGEIKDSLSSFIRTSAKEYPEFFKNQVAADEAYATIAKSKKYSEFIVDMVKEYPKVFLGAALGPAIHSGITGSMFGLGSVGALAGALKSTEFTYRFMKSPVLREHYLKLVGSALRENKNGVINNMRKINKEVEDDPELMKLIKDNS